MNAKGYTENLYAKDCIRTYTGIYMNVFAPSPDMICVEDIAHALSHQCRFSGHLPVFYSVAQHSVLCSEIAKAFKLEALLHDASEAYLLDIPSPIKKRLPEYRKLEESLMAAIAAKFNLTWPFPKEIKNKDKIMLECEWEDLMLKRMKVIAPWTPKYAESSFLNHFYKLYKQA